jgi:type VI secretion system protein ImpA
MSLDLEALLAPISDDAPSGDSLEYDPEFTELEIAAQRKPDQQFGDTVVPGAEPDWEDVAQRAAKLLGRSKDLRAAMHLAQAVIRSEGFPGFRDALALVDGYLDRFWDSLHPQLDPDDDNDPTMRVNLLGTLCNVGAIIKPVRDAPLAASRVFGTVSTRAVTDLDAAEAKPADEESAEPASAGGPSRSDVEAIFMDCPLEDFQATVAAIRESIGLARHIEEMLTTQVGAGNAIDMSALTAALKEAEGTAAPWLARRTQGEDAASTVVAEEPAGEADDTGRATVAAGSAAARGAGRAGVHSRDDAVRALDEICRYFEQHEPSSPVPLLLSRAKRWVALDFMAILEDVSPDAAREVEKLKGGAPSE